MIKTIYQGWNRTEIQDDLEQGGVTEVSDALSHVYPFENLNCAVLNIHVHTYIHAFIPLSSIMRDFLVL